jgi:hypothetical protein
VASPKILLLLPPSEGKAELGASSRWQPESGAFGTVLADRRRAVAEALAMCGGGDEKLLGVGGKHLLRAQSVNAALLGAPTLTAGERYTGVVWDHLGVASMTTGVRRRANTSVVVVSGLLGLVALNDPAPDYRLKMGANLAPFGKLSTWWRPAVSAALDEFCTGRFVIDLLPHEHRAAWSPGDDIGGVSVSFVERTGKVAGHDAKAAKGRLARHLLESASTPRRALASWADDRFDLVVDSLR